MMQQSQVEPSRDMVQCSRVRYSKLELWYNVVESGRAMQCEVDHRIVQYNQVSHLTMWQSLVEPSIESSGALVQCSRITWSPGTMQQSQVEPWCNVEESSRAILQSQVDPMAHARWQSQVQPCYSVVEESSKAMVERIQCSRVKQSHCTIQQSQVELRRAMQQSQVEPSRAMAECIRVKWSHHTMQYGQVEPWYNIVESGRAKWSHATMLQSHVD